MSSARLLKLWLRLRETDSMTGEDMHGIKRNGPRFHEGRPDDENESLLDAERLRDVQAAVAEVGILP